MAPAWEVVAHAAALVGRTNSPSLARVFTWLLHSPLTKNVVASLAQSPKRELVQSLNS